MPTCQYAGQPNCTPTDFWGDPISVTSTSPHENFIEHYLMLGTSPTDWAINGFIWLLIIRLVLWPFVIAPILDWLDFRRQQKIKTVALELIPHHMTSVPAEATTEFFKIMHTLYAIQPYEDHLLRRKQLITCELVSVRGGIRYIVRVPQTSIGSFQQAITGLQHEIQFKEAEDYLDSTSVAKNGTTASSVAFRQLRSFAYPLRRHTALGTHDPMTYLTSAIAKPKPGEVLVQQMVLYPYTSRRAAKIRNKLVHGKNPWLLELNSALPINLFLLLCKWTVIALLFMFNIAVFIIGLFEGSLSLPRGGGGNSGPVMVTPAAQQVRDSMIDKLGEPLFYADIRAYIAVKGKKAANERLRNITGALATFDEPGYQALAPGNRLLPPLVGRLVNAITPESVWQRLQAFSIHKFVNHLPSLFTFNASVLSVSEIAGLYHFPYEQAVTTEGVVRSMSRTLAAPPIIKKRADSQEFSVILGENIHHGDMTNIGLVAKEREKHLYIIGGTGNGKTTLMEYAAVQDIRNGKGVAVVDPHGDSAKKILKYIPEERIKDVIYLNPIDIKHPIGLNLLELPSGLDEDELLLEKGRVTSAVVSVMRKVFSDDDANAHRIEAIMRNAVHTALTVEGATLFTVLKLLRNAKFRKEVVSKLEDEDLKDFWQEEIGQAGDMQMVSMTKGVTQRIDRFSISVPAKRMLGQSKSTINFEDIMDSGKILICNLGDLEEDETSLFGTTVLAKLKMAAERRSRMPENERQPFYVYVDEFQNFATTPFVKMLSSSRKFKLFLTIAEQSTKQQEDDRLTEAILSNVSTVVCFRTGSHDDEELMLHRFEPFVKKGEISNLPAYNFYLRIQAQESIEPMSGQTIVLPVQEANEDMAAVVVKASQDAYATVYVKPAKVEETDEQQSQPDNSSDDKGRGKKKGNTSLDKNDDT